MILIFSFLSRSLLNCLLLFLVLVLYCGLGRSYFKKLKFLGSLMVFRRLDFLVMIWESVTFLTGFQESELVLIMEELSRSSVLGLFSGFS